MSGHRIEDVWLSNLRYVDLKLNQQPQANRTDGVLDDNSETTTHEPASLSGTFPRNSEAKAYDRLAADKPGEELTPDATIWKLYVAEAEESDRELVEREHRHIDVMLVFAALFSAILTAFLLDSKELMQPDPADTTNMLLARIAQRLENPSAGPQPVEIPAFEITLAARWINGLWLASLGLSLAATLLAMMAKEWLATFTSYRPRLAYAYAIDRQARLDAMSSWGALPIIDHLPLLLHFALLLFSLGLVVYLYTWVDRPVATLIALMTGVTILFYVIATGLAAVYEVCPFDTQLSHYCRRLFRFISSHWKFAQPCSHNFATIRPKSPDYTTKADLHALQWLAKNARDPRISDSAYQALAGLRLQPPSESPMTSSTLESSHPAHSNVLRESEQKDKLVASMFADVCQRLQQARPISPHELAASFGVNVARYASTLPQFVTYMNSHFDQVRLAELVWARMAKTGARFIGTGMEMEAFDPSRTALDALDSILHDGCPPFTADAYAWITAAELRLTTSIAGIAKDHDDTVTSNVDYPGGSLSCLIPSETVTIDPQFGPATKVTLFDLRARYSRSLARASIQMAFHSDGSAPMSAFSLIRLLESIHDAAQCSALNPPTSLSTHHPQDPQNAFILPRFSIVAAGTASSYSLTSGEIGDPHGILGGILNVLGASGTYPVAGVEITTAIALEALAPLLLQQWLDLPTPSIATESQEIEEETRSRRSIDLRPHNSGLAAPEPVPSPISLSLDSWPPRQLSDSAGITGWVLSQILHLAAFAKRYHNRPGVGQLLELSLRAFDMRSKNRYPESLLVWAEKKNAEIVRYLATTQDFETTPPQGLESIADCLLRLLAFKYKDCSIFSVSGTDPSDLFRIIQNASTSVTLVEKLLVDVSRHGSQDLLHFTRTDRGFRQLLEIAERSEYIPAVALCVFDVITKTTASSLEQSFQNDQALSTPAEDEIEALLEAARIVLNHPPAHGKKVPHLSPFLSNMFLILDSFQGDQTAQLVSRYLPRKELERTIQSNLANAKTKKVVWAGLERYKLGDMTVGS